MIWNLLLGLLFLGAARYGDYISDECPQGGYTCPKICDVDHKHFPREECEKKTKKTKVNIMPKNCEDRNLSPKDLEDCKAYRGRFAKIVKKNKDIVHEKKY